MVKTSEWRRSSIRGAQHDPAFGCDCDCDASAELILSLCEKRTAALQRNQPSLDRRRKQAFGTYNDQMTKKKTHHFVHDGYIDAWRTSNRIFAFDLVTQSAFQPTGRNSVGAIGKFNNFSFDDTVISLLNYTFRDKALRADAGGIYELMLRFTNFMKDFDYEHKTENLLEDFYGQIETKIGGALSNVFRGELQIVSKDPEVFDGLIHLYCLQWMRTPKARRAMANHMVEIFYDDARLSARQKDEYIKMYLFISSLAMTVEILDKGCVLRLRYARDGEKFVNSDAPVIVSGGSGTSLEDHKGSIPLSPRLLMEVDSVGLGSKVLACSDIANAEVARQNRRMITNADRTVYFSSNNQRAKHLDLMLSQRRQKKTTGPAAPLGADAGAG